MNYTFFYPVWSGVFLALWLLLYWYRADIRRQMLVISIIFGLGGMVSEKIFIKDWWHPHTITGTPIGVEDFVIGFSIAGIAAVIYEILFRRRLSARKKTDAARHGRIFLSAFALLFLAFFYILKLSSFYAAILAYMCGIAYLAANRKDLIFDSVISGLLLMAIGSAVYYLLEILYPGFIQSFWYLKDTWYSTLIFGIPTAEYIWFFFTGAFIGPLYEFLNGSRLSSLR